MSLRENFSNSIQFTVINKCGKGAVVQITTVFRPIYYVACRKVPWNGTLKTIIQAPFSEPVISEIDNLLGSSFFENVQNLT